MAQYVTLHDKKIATGDTVRIHQTISEGDKKRVQIFEGIVIAIKNRGTGKTMTVRKVSAGGVGVEKIFPVNLPSIKSIDLKAKGHVRRSKLYYLRDRIGKAATRIKEKKTALKATA